MPIGVGNSIGIVAISDSAVNKDGRKLEQRSVRV